MGSFQECHDHDQFSISKQGVLFFYTKEDNFNEDLSSNDWKDPTQVSVQNSFTALKEELVKSSKKSESDSFIE